MIHGFSGKLQTKNEMDVEINRGVKRRGEAGDVGEPVRGYFRDVPAGVLGDIFGAGSGAERFLPTRGPGEEF